MHKSTHSPLQPFRLTPGEVSGALGDVGVLLPLAAALISVNGLSATSVFFGLGVAYTVSGIAYRLPIPVQPLKAASAIAIAQGLSERIVTGAGWLMGLLLLGLVVTDIPARLGKLFTRPLIRGVQLGLGLLLVRSGLQLASQPQIVAGGAEHVIHLSLGNAVYATVDTAHSYFGQDARRVTPKSLMQTMCISQLIAALFGGVPVCHGSGGVTAHYKTGARTGLAPVLMGGLCLGLALFVDGNLLPILALIPNPVLGVLLAFVGAQHGLLARDLQGWSTWSVALVTASVGIAAHNLTFGFAAGMVLDQAIRLAHRSALFPTSS